MKNPILARVLRNSVDAMHVHCNDYLKCNDIVLVNKLLK